MHRLRGHTDVRHHRDLSLHQARDQLHAALAAFDLYGFRSAFLEEADGIADGLGLIDLVAAVGHVRDQQRAANGAADGADMVQHLVDRYRERVFVAENDVGERIAYQHDVDAGFIHQARGRIVVGGETDQPLAGMIGSKTGRRSFASQNVGHGDLAVARIEDAELHAVTSGAVPRPPGYSPNPGTEISRKATEVRQLGQGALGP